MFVIYLRTIFHIPSSSGPLVIAVKWKANCEFSHYRQVVLSNSTKTLPQQSYMFSEDISIHIISGPY